MININRPLSPHLTIYNPQRSSLISIWHRISGVTIFVLIVSTLLLLNQAYFSYTTIFLTKFLSDHAISSLLLFCCRLLISIIFLYHITNGIYHFLWDSVMHVNTKRIHKDNNLLLFFLFVNTTLQFYIMF
uniref:Succinate:cytochrome c oxidoreductase subunit 3 n=1 Tax=Porphyra yamadae TaxID=683351 RepID=H3JS68_9RHOD|nr:succinate:cytochrome c oxidoreductase subunit 3 [Porphyra yamadae]